MSNTMANIDIHSLIGGIEVTKEEKEKNLKLINEAIIKNNKGELPLELDKEIFAKSYPESLNLIKKYYDSLYNARVANIKIWDGNNYVNRNQKMEYFKSKKNKELLDALIIFMPIIIEKDLMEIKKLLGIRTYQINALFDRYKKIINENSNSINQIEEEYAKKIYEEIVINGMTKKEFCHKYKVSNDNLDKYIDTLKNINEEYYNELKFILNENIVKEYKFLKELTLKIGFFSKNKIQININNEEILIPFTMLDYYCLTNYSPKTVIQFINNLKNFNSDSKENLIKRSYARQILQFNLEKNQPTTKEKILTTGMAAGREGNVIKITEEICDKIFELFDKENIPQYKFLIEKAFYRYALNQPILPLKLMENIEFLDEFESLDKTSTDLKKVKTK